MRDSRRLLPSLLALSALLSLGNCSLAQQPAAAEPPARPPASRTTPGRAEKPGSLSELVTAIVLDNLPDQYEDKKHWGMKKEVWRGVRFSGKPFELKMNSRKKEVNHGTWHMYRISLVHPERLFQTRLENTGSAGPGRFGFDAIVNARIHCFARLAQWESGVQLIALSTDAVADVELTLRCEAGIRFDMTGFSPAIALDPKVTAADLKLLSFRVQRISQINGALAHELGKALRDILERKIESMRHKMVAKINRQIDKKRDKLRFSITDLGRKAWTELSDLAGLD